MKVRYIVAILVALIVPAVLHTLAYGALFPWSPYRPGYDAKTFTRATVVYPSDVSLPEALSRTDDIIAEVESSNRLRFSRVVTIILCDSWTLFNRGALLGFNGTPRPVLGAALQTGTVIYLSPLAREPGRDLKGVLKHELTHAAMFQQMPLRATFDLVKLDWFEEGLSVLFGNANDYMDDDSWRELAHRPEYAVFAPSNSLSFVPEDLRGIFRLSEYRIFTEYLIDRYGEERFFEFRNAVLNAPSSSDEVFELHFKEPFSAVAGAFEKDVQAGRWPTGSR